MGRSRGLRPSNSREETMSNGTRFAKRPIGTTKAELQNFNRNGITIRRIAQSSRHLSVVAAARIQLEKRAA